MQMSQFWEGFFTGAAVLVVVVAVVVWGWSKLMSGFEG
jgi:hypothetical protein